MPFVYFVSGKVLVTTGDKSEVIDLEDSNNICQDLEDYPIQVFAAVGGLLNQVYPLVCGGQPYTKSCYIVNQPGQSSEMIDERRQSASLTLNSTHLWITGGYNGNGILKRSEFVSIGQPAVKGPDLPFAVYEHCLVIVNSSTALLCGGENNVGVFNECHYMNLVDHSWSQGPSMMTKRYDHSCGIFKSATHQGRNVIIAAGGLDDYGEWLDSVEILDPTTNTWNEGKILYVPLIRQQIQISVDQPYTGPAASCCGINGTHSIFRYFLPASTRSVPPGLHFALLLLLFLGSL
jgi:hypothetical protein